MALGFEKFGLSDDEILAQIQSDAHVDAGLQEFMEGKVVPFWRSHTPVLKTDGHGSHRRPGAAKAAVRVTKKARGGKGQVGMRIFYAHFIEHGTSKTPQSAPGQKTATHFGGTLDYGAQGARGGAGEGKGKGKGGGKKKGGKSKGRKGGRS